MADFSRDMNTIFVFSVPLFGVPQLCHGDILGHPARPIFMGQIIPK
jgi:hypothetical protein